MGRSGAAVESLHAGKAVSADTGERMSRDLIIRQADELDMWVRTGTVVGHQQSVHASTTVTTSGGGGYLHKGTGYVHAPTTTASTTSEEKLQLFIRRDDGTEFEVSF